MLEFAMGKLSIAFFSWCPLVSLEMTTIALILANGATTPKDIESGPAIKKEKSPEPTMTGAQIFASNLVFID